LRLVAISVLPLSFAMIQAESLRGLKNIRASQWIKNVLTSLITLVLLYPLVSWLGASGAVAAYVIGAVITAIAAWRLWLNTWRARVGADIPVAHDVSMKSLFRSSWPLYGVAITGLVMQQAATIFLGVWGTAGEIGVFNVANRVSSLLLFPLLAMINILAPKFAAMHRQGDWEGLKGLARSSSRMLTIFAVPVAVLVAICSEWILAIFGPEFKDGAMVLTILLIGVAINVATGAVAELLMMSGFEKVVSGGVAISALITLALCLVLIPKYGQVGAAIAVTSGMSIQNLLMVAGVKIRLGFWPVALMTK
jgi:O-antigen/teichoic acid export membrane protein